MNKDQRKGLEKLFKAELFTVILSVCGLVMVFVPAARLILALVVIVLALIAFFKRFKATKLLQDVNGWFKFVRVWIWVAFIVSLFSDAEFEGAAPVIPLAIAVINAVSNAVLMFSVCFGLKEFYAKAGDEKFAQTSMILGIVVLIGEAASGIGAKFFSSSLAATTCFIVAEIAIVFGYFLHIRNCFIKEQQNAKD